MNVNLNSFKINLLDTMTRYQKCIQFTLKPGLHI